MKWLTLFFLMLVFGVPVFALAPQASLTEKLEEQVRKFKTETFSRQALQSLALFLKGMLPSIQTVEIKKRAELGQKPFDFPTSSHPILYLAEDITLPELLKIESRILSEVYWAPASFEQMMARTIRTLSDVRWLETFCREHGMKKPEEISAIQELSIEISQLLLLLVPEVSNEDSKRTVQDEEWAKQFLFEDPVTDIPKIVSLLQHENGKTLIAEWMFSRFKDAIFKEILAPDPLFASLENASIHHGVDFLKKKPALLWQKGHRLSQFFSKWDKKNKLKRLSEEDAFFEDLDHELGVLPRGGPSNIREMTESGTAQCVAIALLALTVFQTKGYDEIYWLNVSENNRLIPESHAALIVKKKISDTYVLFDPSMGMRNTRVHFSEAILAKVRQGETVSVCAASATSTQYVESDSRTSPWISEEDRKKAASLDYPALFVLHPVTQMMPALKKNAGYHQSALSHFCRAEIGKILNRQPSQVDVVHVAQRLMRMNPQDPFVYEGLASALASQKQWDEVIPLMDKALSMLPHHLALLENKARFLIEMGKNLEAVGILNHVLEIDGKRSRALFYLGQAYIGLSNRTNAQKSGVENPLILAYQYLLEAIKQVQPGDTNFIQNIQTQINQILNLLTQRNLPLFWEITRQESLRSA